MAKKNADPEKEEAFIRLALTPKQRDQLRVIAARDGASMATYCRNLVVADIERRVAKGDV